MLCFVHHKVKTEVTLQEMKYAAKSDSFFVTMKQMVSDLFKTLFLHTSYTFLTQYL